MLKRTRKTKQLAVEFSERSGKVCDAACRQTALIDRQRDRVLRSGWKFV